MDQILAEEDVDGGTPELVKWTLTDHLNTVRDIARYDSESDTTTVVNHLVYDAYGNVTSETNSAVESLFLFTARPLDADTGLQNNLNRWYDPAVGRWLSEDPVGYEPDINLYRYVYNNPLIHTDPSGEAIAAALPIAGGCAAADGPFPAGEVVGGVIIVGAICYDVGVTVVDVCQNHGCYPCIPAVGTISYRGPDTTHGHWPFVTGTHYHLYRMSQSPWPMCKCWWMRWGTVGTLPAGAVPITPAAGGGAF